MVSSPNLVDRSLPTDVILNRCAMRCSPNEGCLLLKEDINRSRVCLYFQTENAATRRSPKAAIQDMNITTSLGF